MSRRATIRRTSSSRTLALDEYLKTQSAFDAELAKTLESPEFASDPAWRACSTGLYDVRASLDRAVDQAKSGRGMAALDALTHARGDVACARRAGASRPPTEIDRVAEGAGKNLRDMRATWADASRTRAWSPCTP